MLSMINAEQTSQKINFRLASSKIFYKYKTDTMVISDFLGFICTNYLLMVKKVFVKEVDLLILTNRGYSK